LFILGLPFPTALAFLNICRVFISFDVGGIFLPVAPLLLTFHAIMASVFYFHFYYLFNKAKISTPYENTVLPYCLNLFDFFWQKRPF
jgi:hypothetical protein